MSAGTVTRVFAGAAKRPLAERFTGIRSARANELAALAELALRSKGHWGYDAAFLEACRTELTLTPAELTETATAVIDANGAPVAMAQVSSEGRVAWLEKLFVDPAHMGQSLGRRLFAWSVETARGLGAVELVIESDPDAEPYYLHMGAVRSGFASSGSIPGRTIPRLILPLQDAAPIRAASIPDQV